MDWYHSHSPSYFLLFRTPTEDDRKLFYQRGIDEYKPGTYCSWPIPLYFRLCNPFLNLEIANGKQSRSQSPRYLVNEGPGNEIGPQEKSRAWGDWGVGGGGEGGLGNIKNLVFQPLSISVALPVPTFPFWTPSLLSYLWEPREIQNAISMVHHSLFYFSEFPSLTSQKPSRETCGRESCFFEDGSLLYLWQSKDVLVTNIS